MELENPPLNTLLFIECQSKNPDTDKIINLILDGADINASIDDENLIIFVLRNGRREIDVEFIQFLIELGADLNFRADNFNSIEEGCLTRNPDVVELLLKSGANPNSICVKDNQSILDLAFEIRKWIEDFQYPELDMKTTKIIKILKQYGAKTLIEISNENNKKPNQILNYETGN